MLPDNQLVNLVQDLLATNDGRLLLNKHGFLPQLPPLEPHVSMTEVIAVLKLLCVGAGLACPVIESMS